MEEEVTINRAVTQEPPPSRRAPNGSGAAIVPPVPDADLRLINAATPKAAVRLVDVEERHIRRPSDLVSTVVNLLILTLVVLVAYLGPETTAGVTEDVQDAVNRTARQILLLPVAFIEGLVIFLVPLTVLLAQTLQRQWRVIVQALLAGGIAYVLAFLLVNGLSLLESTHPLNLALAQNSRGVNVPALAPYVATLSGLLTAVGRASSSRVVRISWAAIVVVVMLAVLQGDLALSGALVSAFLGRTIGFLMRWAMGVRSSRAAGLSLVRGLRRAGLRPSLVVRLDSAPSTVHSWMVSSTAPVGHAPAGAPTTTHAGSVLGSPDASPPGGATAAPPAPANGEPRFGEVRTEVDRSSPGMVRSPDQPAPPPDRPSTLDELMRALDTSDEVMVPNPLPLPAEVEELLQEQPRPDPFNQHRHYAVFENGRRRDVSVLDGDRQLVGFLATMWDAMRLRGIDRPMKPSLRESAQHAALMAFAAREAGVRVPSMEAIARANDSILMVYPHIPGGRAFSELVAHEIRDEHLQEFWQQLHLAHNAGISHRSLTAAHVVVESGGGSVWLTGWENGEVATSELSRRIDLAQALTMLATRVGTDRAIAAASAALSEAELTSLAPLLQQIVMPPQTRAEMPRRFLHRLGEELLRLVPAAADAPPATLQRLTFKQLLTISVGFAAVVLLFGTFNWDQVAAAFRDANPAWLVAAFGAGLATYYGAALGLVSFTPEKLRMWRTTLVQVASSIVSLVAPAGVGPAAIDIRYLTKERVQPTLAVATVTMVQVTRFLTTVALLIMVTVVAGAAGSAGSMVVPSGAVMIVVAILVAVAGVLVAIPPVRGWASRRVMPVLRQIWPRVLWVVGNPGRLAAGVLGNVIQTVGYVAAFGMTLAAFGYELPVATLTIAYLASASAGSLVPSPAGIGPVEVALTSGLTIAGIPSPVAVSVTLVFRVLTLYARIPLGWLSLRYLQSRNVL
nr:UPF0104 family protein [Actinomycetales bacterium]